MSTSLLNYTLELADNALILGHRISEWCGHGPVLEQDIAITNIALDHLGQARNLYQYAAKIYNQLTEAEQRTAFSSPAFLNKRTVTEDDLAYLRDAWDFRNVLLVEQSNEDWAFTIIRSFFYDVYAVAMYTRLQNSKDETLAAIARKSLKEATYHRKWSSEWVIRLGDGTDESHKRIAGAVSERWQYSGELFIPSGADTEMSRAGTGADIAAIKEEWQAYVAEVFKTATLQLPGEGWMQEGGKEGRHSEHLGYVLAEMQFMQRAYPGMEW